MRSLPLTLTLALAVLAAAPAVAQTYVVHRVLPTGTKGYEDVHISKAAEPGQQIRLWWATLINPDCTAAGTMDTRIVTPPHHGQASISDDPLFPSFPEPNPRSACNATRVPGKQAFYTPDASFHGHDKLVFQNATSEGRMRRLIVDVDVR